jgi:hypothetical protein
MVRGGVEENHFYTPASDMKRLTLEPKSQGKGRILKIYGSNSSTFFGGITCYTRAGDITLSIFRCFSSASDIEPMFLIESRVLCLQR